MLHTDATAPTLSGPQLVALLRPQVAHLIMAIEQNGVELGMLLETLLGLIERHDAEGLRGQPSSEPTSPDEQRLHEQLAADHRTMLSFSGPLILLRQFYDRLRQRLEHLDRALASLPMESLRGHEHFERTLALFPLEEERLVTARVCGIDEPLSDGADVELFK